MMDILHFPVAHHFVPHKNNLFFADFGYLHTSHLFVRGKGPELEKRQLFAFCIVGKFHVGGHAHLFFEEGGKVFHDIEEFRVPSWKI